MSKNPKVIGPELNIVGKTVSAVRVGRRTYVKFTDGTALFLEGTEDDGTFGVAVDESPDIYAQHAAGLLNRRELDRALENAASGAHERRRREYERLKAEFEPVDPAARDGEGSGNG